MNVHSSQLIHSYPVVIQIKNFYRLTALLIWYLFAVFYIVYHHSCSLLSLNISFSGHVGPPLPCNIIKLVDVPEKECYAKDGIGEVNSDFN